MSAKKPTTAATGQSGAQLLVRHLEAQGVEYVFGIPGAKVDNVFDALLDSKIKTIVCRHEQNAAFIAGGIGRLTGKAGVVLVTSGPGCANLVTGLATANTEGEPIVAFGGSPKDIMASAGAGDVLAPASVPPLGPAGAAAIEAAVKLIDAAERPVLLLGMLASQPGPAAAIRALLGTTQMAVASTYQAAGVIPRERIRCFGGRVRPFHNHPAHILPETTH